MLQTGIVPRKEVQIKETGESRTNGLSAVAVLLTSRTVGKVEQGKTCCQG